MNKKKCNYYILLYRRFVLNNFDLANAFWENHDWHDDSDVYLDWQQANWEILVERQIMRTTEFLSPLTLSKVKGNRVVNKSVDSTHYIICKYKNLNESKDDTDILVFRNFVDRDNGIWGVYPDLSYACVLSLGLNKLMRIEQEKLIFEIQTIPEEFRGKRF